VLNYITVIVANVVSAFITYELYDIIRTNVISALITYGIDTRANTTCDHTII